MTKETLSTDLIYAQYLHNSLFQSETIPKPTKHRCWPNILKLLRRLATAPAGFQIICDVFYQEPEYLENTVTLTLYGLSDKGSFTLY